MTPEQKTEVEILRSQGETDERISAYLGVEIPKAKGTPKAKTTEAPAPVTPDDLA